MAIDLKVHQCNSCGKLFQPRMRDVCNDCGAKEDALVESAERELRRNRHLTNEQLASAIDVTLQKVRGWIRKGTIRLYDYPNLFDFCDSCDSPIRSGKLCFRCTSRIKGEIAHTLEQERLMRERLRSQTFISRK